MKNKTKIIVEGIVQEALQEMIPVYPYFIKNSDSAPSAPPEVPTNLYFQTKTFGAKKIADNIQQAIAKIAPNAKLKNEHLGGFSININGLDQNAVKQIQQIIVSNGGKVSGIEKADA